MSADTKATLLTEARAYMETIARFAVNHGLEFNNKEDIKNAMQRHYMLFADTTTEFQKSVRASYINS